MKSIIITTTLILSSLVIFAQHAGFDYFGFPSPGTSIELFAPRIVSLSGVREKSLAISPEGDEIFFSGGKTWPETKIMHVQKTNNQWGEPKEAEFCKDCFATEPAFSPDGKYLYFSSSKGEIDIKRYCIWRMEKIGKGWGLPQKIIDMNDPNVWEFHPTVTRNGILYFCYWDGKKQEGSIYKSVYSNGVYAEPTKVAIPFNVQSSDTDPFIDPDGNYLIFSSTGQNGKGGYDAYISYGKDDGSWSFPMNAGDRFNTSEDDDSFDVSPDGRFVFIYKQNEVYWTESKGVVDKL